jgi:hypothetical protein
MLRTIGVPLNAVVKIRVSKWKKQTIFFKLLIISRKIFNILPQDYCFEGFRHMDFDSITITILRTLRNGS